MGIPTSDTAAAAPESTSMNPNDFYERLIKEAPLIPGDTGEVINPESITWYNPDLLREGQDFINRNYCSQGLALCGALIFGTTFKRVTTVLLRTGQFSTPRKAFVRHVETQLHVDRWLTENIMDAGSKGYKDLQHVRQLHLGALRRCQKVPLKLNVEGIEDVEGKEKLLEALRKDLEHCVDTSQAPKDLVTYSPTVYFSQFDFAMVLYGMYAMLYLYPKLLGISDTRGIDGLIHFWALVGRLLGLQDRFNPALCPDREMHFKIIRTLLLPNIMEMDVSMLDLSQSYCKALAKAGIPGSIKSLLYVGLKSASEVVPGFKGENMYELMSWGDLVKVRIIQVSLWSLYYVPFARSFVNQAVRIMEWIALRRTASERRNKVQL